MTDTSIDLILAKKASNEVKIRTLEAENVDLDIAVAVLRSLSAKTEEPKTPYDETLVEFKPDEVKEMIEQAEVKPADPPAQQTVNSPQLPREKIILNGRYLIVGQIAINLFPDEVKLAAAMLNKFGETLKKSDAHKLDRKPEIPILRLKSRLEKSGIHIEVRHNGWALANEVASPTQTETKP